MLTINSILFLDLTTDSNVCAGRHFLVHGQKVFAVERCLSRFASAWYRQSWAASDCVSMSSRGTKQIEQTVSEDWIYALSELGAERAGS